MKRDFIGCETAGEWRDVIERHYGPAAESRALESGVLAEQFHPYTGGPMSVAPLTWSHATFVIVALEYLEKHAQLGLTV